MKNLITLILISTFWISCQDYDENVIPLVGTYEAQVVAVSTPFTMAVSYDTDDMIFIDALFDGFNWGTIYCDIDDQEEDIKRIRIDRQNIGSNADIEGNGFYLNNSIQLDYTLYFLNEEADFTLVATKL